MSLVDSTWRWRRLVGNRWFYRFWGQVIRFTSFGRLLGKTPRFALHTDQREYTLGSTIRITAKVLDREFAAEAIDLFEMRADTDELRDQTAAWRKAFTSRHRSAARGGDARDGEQRGRRRRRRRRRPRRSSPPPESNES